MNREQGFIKTIIVIVIALIILGYYGYDVREIINYSAVQNNLSYAKDLGLKAWDFIRTSYPQSK